MEIRRSPEDAERRGPEEVVVLIKRFARYKTASELYEIGRSKLEQMAKDAGAIYKIDKLVLINLDIFEEYLEGFRIP